jgi:hypothetical protein
MTTHPEDCPCIGCEDARAGIKRTFYKGVVLSCDSDTATVRGEDGLVHKFLRPKNLDGIDPYNWAKMHVVGKEITWSAEAKMTCQWTDNDTGAPCQHPANVEYKGLWLCRNHRADPGHFEHCEVCGKLGCEACAKISGIYHWFCDTNAHPEEWDALHEKKAQ